MSSSLDDVGLGPRHPPPPIHARAAGKEGFPGAISMGQRALVFRPRLAGRHSDRALWWDGSRNGGKERRPAESAKCRQGRPTREGQKVRLSSVAWGGSHKQPSMANGWRSKEERKNARRQGRSWVSHLPSPKFSRRGAIGRSRVGGSRQFYWREAAWRPCEKGARIPIRRPLANRGDPPGAICFCPCPAPLPTDDRFHSSSLLHFPLGWLP